MSNTKVVPPVVFYGYEASPASAKLENVLALKGVPHYRVEVAMMLPRPDISAALGIGYRRIPILAIGNDVYCDTSLAAPVIERHFRQSEGFPTLFPSRKDGGKTDTGMIKILATFYADRPLFSLASLALPYNKFPKPFIDDRNKFWGVPMNVDKVVANQPSVRSLLTAHMTLIEEQLSDEREWVFDTVTPGYGDLALYGVFGWIIHFRGMRETLSAANFPKSNAWLARMADFVKSKRETLAPAITIVDGAAAAKLIAESAGIRTAEIEFDHDQANLLGLKLGDKVQVIPDDNAKNYPTIGKLVGLNREEVVLELGGSAVPSLHCHFPRLNFTVNPNRSATSKL